MTPPPRRSLAAAGCALASFLLSASVCAQSAVPTQPDAQDNQNRARADFQSGVSAFAQGSYAVAIDHFNASIRAFETPAAQLNLSVCLERVGRVVEARRSLVRYEELAHGRMPPGREEQIHDASVRLESLIVRLNVRVLGEHVDVTIDGRPLSVEERARPLELDPGPHVLTATAPQTTPVNINRTFGPGLREDIVLAPEPIDVITRMRVRSSVPSAEISVDNMVLGTGVVDQRLQPGSHALSVRARGYLPYSSSLVLTPGENASIEARLVRDVPVVERPWFWVVLTSVVSGVVVGVAIAADAQPRACMAGTQAITGPMTMNGCLVTP